MVRAILVMLLVTAVIAGGLLMLRRSARTGLPDEDVLKRAQRRADAERARDGD